MSRISKSNFFIKLRSWEYWPFGIVQFPSIIQWLWMALRARSLFFFSASNPGIPMGGMFGESKFDILKKIPPAVIAKSSIVRIPSSRQEIINRIAEMGLTFPVIFKPDLGERGWMVERIKNEAAIDDYLARIRTDFILQECIDLPLEFGVYYRRYPSEQVGEVVSIVAKEMLSVTGNGVATLRDLILKSDRAKLQWEKLQVKFAHHLNEVPARGVRIELVSIGNHCLGTTFLDGHHHINPQLSAAFDKIAQQIEGFYYGRFDLRVASVHDLNIGNVKIMELNGCGAEPAHIYQPGFPFREALRVLKRHWDDIYRISMENRKSGVTFISFSEAMQRYKKFKAIVGK